MYNIQLPKFATFLLIDFYPSQPFGSPATLCAQYLVGQRAPWDERSNVAPGRRRSGGALPGLVLVVILLARGWNQVYQMFDPLWGWNSKLHVKCMVLFDGFSFQTILHLFGLVMIIYNFPLGGWWTIAAKLAVGYTGIDQESCKSFSLLQRKASTNGHGRCCLIFTGNKKANVTCLPSLFVKCICTPWN